MNLVTGEICFQPATRKLRNRCSRLLGWVSWRFKRGPPVLERHASSSVFDRGEYIERKPLSQATHTRLR